MSEQESVHQKRARLLSLLFLGVLGAIVLYLVILILKPFAEILVAAALLTIAFYPLYEMIHRRVKNPSAAAGLSVASLLVSILLPLAVLSATVAGEARDLYQTLHQQSLQQGGWSGYLNRLAEGPTQWIASKTGMAAPDLRAALLGKMEQVISVVLKWSGAVFGNVTATLANVVLTLIVMFFLFQAGNRMRRLAAYLPIETERLERLAAALKATIAANLYGMVTVASVQGILVSLGFVFTGLASPVFWGLMAAFASLIPFVGTALVWLPGVILLAIWGSYGKAVFLLVWGAAVVSMSDQVVRPLVLKRGLEMNTLAIFLSLMGGVQAFGFIGLIAGPVIFAMAYVLLKMLHEERLAWEGRGQSKDGTNV
jgi:predicted PurR-regulated permease PerM